MSDDSMRALLVASLAWWKIDGAVTAEPDGALTVRVAAMPEQPLRIARAAPGMPFRWQVTYAGRTRSVSSVAGVLRTVRAVVDPAHQRSRAQVGGSAG